MRGQVEEPGPSKVNLAGAKGIWACREGLWTDLHREHQYTKGVCVCVCVCVCVVCLWCVCVVLQVKEGPPCGS